VEDLSRFKQTYFEESAELLAVAEAGLLRLEPGTFDDDEVNAIFRAVHSIKGGGGAFGFADLVAFAHEFETVMDGVRNHAIAITTPLTDTLIRANDVLGQMLALARDGAPTPSGLGAEIVAALRRHAGGPGAPVPKPPPPVKSLAEEADEDFGIYDDALDDILAARTAVNERVQSALTGVPVAEGKARWAITFLPKPDLMLSGNEPSFMLRALRRLGEATVTCHIDRLPALGAIESEFLYLQWTVVVVTDASVTRSDIDDIFEFVADESEIIVATDSRPSVAEVPAPVGAEPLPAPVEAAPAPAAAVPEQRATRSRSSDSTPGGLTSHTIRVDLDKIDRLVNMVGEMVITQAMVAEHVRDLPKGEFQHLLEGLEQLAQYTRELRESVMSIRAQPVSSVFSRMPRLVRDLASDTGKEVQLVTSGETTEVDKTVVENLVDPLTHMIRNSVDHGIEGPDEREEAGKPRVGTVHLSAQHRSGRIVIEVSDDGRGIDRRRVFAKAVEKGLIAANANLSDEEIDNLIFLPGFSTAEKVSNISGRGVGMDVVRRNISTLGGRIGIYSTPGEGSRFVLSLPLTLAVLDGMVISVGSERFVLPLTNIVESLRPSTEHMHGLVNQCDVIMARGAYVRLVHLHRLFGIPNAVTDATKGLVVLVETEEGSRIGLVVDEVLGEQQVVIKSMESNFRRLDGVAAATILGDGRVALILDVAGLRDMSLRGGAGATPRNIPSLPAPETELA
jgi:two-component system, chemotaxis family, sensor kinase CheA